MSIILETTIGDFTIDLFTDERPRTCMNFLKLCKMKYYNHHLFYSIERDFIAQTGDPTGTGKGGESIFKHIHGDKGRFYEGEKMPILKHKDRGTVSMVSCGNEMFGSQFFLTLSENLHSLDNQHLVFGEVVEGMDLVSQLNQTLIDETKRPYKDIRITHTVILFDPFPDLEGLVFPEGSPPPQREMFTSAYIAADENLDEDKSKSLAEIQEEIADKEASARATILEMVGDIPDADMAPPENVLFVCKLNAVTTSEDLEIIFSRFGKIKCVEVIRDKITGNSLQYAFVEFADPKSCEDAFFKMSNVLIDDRRIHVDFSQSVAKIKWKGKGRGVDYFDDSGKKVSLKQEKYSGVTTNTPRGNFIPPKNTFRNKYSKVDEHLQNRNPVNSSNKKESFEHGKRKSTYSRMESTRNKSEYIHDRSKSASDRSDSVHDRSHSARDRSKSARDRSEAARDRIESTHIRSESNDERNESTFDRNVPLRRQTELSRDRIESSHDKFDTGSKNKLYSDRKDRHLTHHDDYRDSRNPNRNMSVSQKDDKKCHRSRKEETTSDSSTSDEVSSKLKRKKKELKKKKFRAQSSSSSESDDSEPLSLKSKKDRKKLIKQLKRELKKSKKHKK